MGSLDMRPFELAALPTPSGPAESVCKKPQMDLDLRRCYCQRGRCQEWDVKAVYPDVVSVGPAGRTPAKMTRGLDLGRSD